MNCVPPKLHFLHYGSNLSYYRKFPMVLKTATIYISNLHHHWLAGSLMIIVQISGHHLVVVNGEVAFDEVNEFLNCLK